MKFVTDGMTELQIDVLHNALRYYAVLCDYNVKRTQNDNPDLASLWKQKSFIADDMANGIGK